MLFQQPGQVAVDTESTRVDAPEQRAEPVNIHFDNPAAAAIMGKLLPAAVKSPDAAASNRAAFVGAFPAWASAYDESYKIAKDTYDSPESFNERRKQDLYEEAKIQDEVKDRRRREKQEMRFDGQLTGGAAAFLEMLEGPDGLLDVEGLKAIPRPDYLIDGLLYQDSLAWIAGESNTYKSFVALDIVCRYACGMLYHTTDYPMAQGSALVVVAEGAAAYGDRVQAWEVANSKSLSKDNVKFYPRALQLADLEIAMPALIAHCRKSDYGLIVFDTQAMCTVGQDENSATDMGVVMNVLHQLREATGACILLIHHFGKGAAGMRGSTAVYGAATTVIAVDRQAGEYGISLSTVAPAGKQKDAKAVSGIHLALNEQTWAGGASLCVQWGQYKPPPVPAVDNYQACILQQLVATEEIDGSSPTSVAQFLNEVFQNNPNTGAPWKFAHAENMLATLKRKGLVRKQGARYAATRLGLDALKEHNSDSASSTQ